MGTQIAESRGICSNPTEKESNAAGFPWVWGWENATGFPRECAAFNFYGAPVATKIDRSSIYYLSI